MFRLPGGALTKDRLKTLARAAHQRYARTMAARGRTRNKKSLKDFMAHLKAAELRLGHPLTRAELNYESSEYLFSTIPGVQAGTTRRGR